MELPTSTPHRRRGGPTARCQGSLLWPTPPWMEIAEARNSSQQASEDSILLFCWGIGGLISWNSLCKRYSEKQSMNWLQADLSLFQQPFSFDCTSTVSLSSFSGLFWPTLLPGLKAGSPRYGQVLGTLSHHLPREIWRRFLRNSQGLKRQT